MKKIKLIAATRAWLAVAAIDSALVLPVIKALQNAGYRNTNHRGRFCVFVEALLVPAKPFTRVLIPGRH